MPEKKAILGYFRELQLKFSRFYTRILTRADLTLPQYALLGHLANAATLPMTDISGKLYVSKPAVTNLVDRLEKKGYLKRLPHPTDRRVSLIRIEPKGKKAVRRIQNQVLKFILQSLERFHPKEQETIIRFYALLSQTIDTYLGQRQ